MNITDLERLLNITHYYIVVYNIDAYAEGITGINYNMKVYCNNLNTSEGWILKKDLSKILSIVKKDNKSTKKIPNSNIGQHNTIRVKTGKELIEDYKNNTTIRYSIQMKGYK